MEKKPYKHVEELKQRSLFSVILGVIEYGFYKTVLMVIVPVYQTLLSIIFYGKRKYVPPVSNPLLLKSATVLAQEIRVGKTKSEVIIQAYIERILEVEPYINATVDRCFKSALEEARKADALVASGVCTKEQLAKDKPLLGVPYTMKLLMTVKGLRCTSGCLSLKDEIAAEDSPCAALFRKAGAIVIATTNIPEFGCGFEAHNNLHGRTNNPYDLSRTSGGSSGGESALIGAAGSVLGIGNDAAGSLRVPSHFTGIYAHKPTSGIVPNEGCFPPLDLLNDYIYAGPMCRYAEDLVVSLNVLTSANKIPMQFGQPVDFKKLKILYLTSLPNNPLVYPIDKEIKLGLHRAVTHFEANYGVEAKEIQIPLMCHANQCFTHALLDKVGKRDRKAWLTVGKGSNVNEKLDALKLPFGMSHFTEGPLLFFNVPNFPLWFSRRNVSFYKEKLKNLENEFGYLLDENTVLFLPTFPTSAPFHYGTIPLLPSTCYTSIFDLIGLPSTQCHLGFDRNRLPYGMQVVGRFNNDPLTVACTIELEKVFGGWAPPEKA